MGEKPPVMTAPKVPEGYPLTPHPPTAKHHHVPKSVSGPQAKGAPTDGIPYGGKGMMLGKDSKPPQTPPPDIHQPVNPPKGARS